MRNINEKFPEKPVLFKKSETHIAHLKPELHILTNDIQIHKHTIPFPAEPMVEKSKITDLFEHNLAEEEFKSSCEKIMTVEGYLKRGNLLAAQYYGGTPTLTELKQEQKENTTQLKEEINAQLKEVIRARLKKEQQEKLKEEDIDKKEETKFEKLLDAIASTNKLLEQILKPSVGLKQISSEKKTDKIFALMELTF